MGEAKRRGTREDRINDALCREELKQDDIRWARKTLLQHSDRNSAAVTPIRTCTEDPDVRRARAIMKKYGVHLVTPHSKLGLAAALLMASLAVPIRKD